MRDRDTGMGGEAASFPTTAWDVVLAARDAEAAGEQLDRLVRSYWKPVYACLRAFWGVSGEEAKDFTQEFFLGLLSRDALAAVNPSKGTFRSYVRACLRNFMLDQRKRAGAAKRSGSKREISLEADEAGLARLVEDSRCATPEETFDKAWFSCLMDSALDAAAGELASSGREREWLIFRAREIDEEGAATTYADLASRFGTTERDVKTVLQNVWRRLRQLARSKISEYCRSLEELEEEFRELFGDR